MDVKILSDDTVCLSVSSRFVRCRTVPGYAPTPHAPDFFLRHPLTSVAGGVSRSRSQTHATAGRLSFSHFLQRLSDRNYAMRACCAAAGAPRYGSFRSPRVATRCVSWRVPPGGTLSELTAHDPQFQGTIVDTFHTDLCDPATGQSLLTLRNLTDAVRESGRRLACLFINRLEHEDCAAAIRLAAQQSTSVQCLTICESALSNETLAAMATLGSSLRGLILSNNHNVKGSDGAEANECPTDAAMASLLAALPRLEFFVFENAHPFKPSDEDRRGSGSGSGSGRKRKQKRRRRRHEVSAKTCTRFFGDACWNALGSQRCCPNLRVLWVDEIHPEWHLRPLSDNRVVHRAMFVAGGGALSQQLDLFMLNPDRELRSLLV